MFSSRGKAKIQAARSAERDQRRLHVPVAERAGEEPPPFTILVQASSWALRCGGGQGGVEW